MYMIIQILKYFHISHSLIGALGNSKTCPPLGPQQPPGLVQSLRFWRWCLATAWWHFFKPWTKDNILSWCGKDSTEKMKMFFTVPMVFWYAEMPWVKQISPGCWKHGECLRMPWRLPQNNPWLNHQATVGQCGTCHYTYYFRSEGKLVKIGFPDAYLDWLSHLTSNMFSINTDLPITNCSMWCPSYNGNFRGAVGHLSGQ